MTDLDSEKALDIKMTNTDPDQAESYQSSRPREKAEIIGITAIVSIVASLLTIWTFLDSIIQSSVTSWLRRDFAPIGTVVASTLPEQEFARLVGETKGDEIKYRTWVLADGKSVTGSQFAKLTGDRPVPDLRGKLQIGIYPDKENSIPGSEVNLFPPFESREAFKLNESGPDSRYVKKSIPAPEQNSSSGHSIDEDVLQAPSRSNDASLRNPHRPAAIQIFFYIKIN